MEIDNQLCICRALQHGLHFHNDDAILYLQGLWRILQVEISRVHLHVALQCSDDFCKVSNLSLLYGRFIRGFMETTWFWWRVLYSVFFMSGARMSPTEQSPSGVFQFSQATYHGRFLRCHYWQEVILSMTWLVSQLGTPIFSWKWLCQSLTAMISLRLQSLLSELSTKS